MPRQNTVAKLRWNSGGSGQQYTYKIRAETGQLSRFIGQEDSYSASNGRYVCWAAPRRGRRLRRLPGGADGPASRLGTGLCRALRRLDGGGCVAGGQRVEDLVGRPGTQLPGVDLALGRCCQDRGGDLRWRRLGVLHGAEARSKACSSMHARESLARPSATARAV